MQKIVLFLVMFIVLSFVSVSAGESYDINFSEGITQAVYLYEDDVVRFELLGGEHVIILNDVGTASVKLGLGPFMDQSNNTKIYETILGLDYILKLDLDKDDIPDVNVALYSIGDDGEVHLVLQDAVEEDIVQDSADNVGLVEESSGLSSKSISLIVIGILVFVLVLYLLFRKGKKGVFSEKKSEEHTVQEQDHTSHEHTHDHAHEHKEHDYKAKSEDSS